MIFGLNFNGTQIPPAIKARFAAYIRLPNMPRGQRARLVGACATEDEKAIMLSQADNGHRRLHVEERKAVHGKFYGIYVY
jgi:hypothetical protein